MPDAPLPRTPAGTRLLIVDDDAQIGASLVQLLRRCGYVAEFVRNGREALACIARHPVDVVLSDIFMPDFDGFELLRDLERVSPRPQLVAMTGDNNPAMPDMLRVAVQLGAERAIRKPFELEQLLQLLDDLLGTGPAGAGSPG